MMGNKKLLSTIVLGCTVVLVGCGSGGSSNGGSGEGVQGGSTLADIAGVWNMSADFEPSSGGAAVLDESYLVITDGGDYVVYDYKGDALGTVEGDFENCYDEETIGKIEDLGGGKFLVDVVQQEVITIQQQVEYSVENNTLTAPLSLLNPGGATASIPAADNLTQADMVALPCSS